MEKFAKRLRELREEKNLTQRDLVIQIKFKVTQPSIALWEQGKRVPSLEAAAILAKFFNVSLDYLAGLTDFK